MINVSLSLPLASGISHRYTLTYSQSDEKIKILFRYWSSKTHSPHLSAHVVQNWESYSHMYTFLKCHDHVLKKLFSAFIFHQSYCYDCCTYSNISISLHMSTSVNVMYVKSNTNNTVLLLYWLQYLSAALTHSGSSLLSSISAQQGTHFYICHE